MINIEFFFKVVGIILLDPVKMKSSLIQKAYSKNPDMPYKDVERMWIQRIFAI